MSRMRKTIAGAGVFGIALAFTSSAVTSADANPTASSKTTTPIKHVVVIYQENVSFDHYFGTYPKAANTSGQPFHGGTTDVNTLATTKGAGGKGTLLTNNPNLDASGKQVSPRRLDPTNINDVLTCDQDHNYNAEQKAFDGGKMDQFVTNVGTAKGANGPGQTCKASDVMNYYDGNTVTGLWNYAKQFAMSDNSFGTTFGPSSPGAINLASGDTGGVGLMINGAATNGDTVSDGKGGNSLIEDAQGYYDDCSTRDAVTLTGKNVGDNLNAAGISWGWFQGGFAPTTSFATATGGTQPTSTFTPDQFKGKFAVAPASVACAMLPTRLVRPSAALAARLLAAPTTAPRTTTSPTTSRSSTMPPPPTRTTCRQRRWQPSAPTLRPRQVVACRSSTPPTTSTTSVTVECSRFSGHPN